MSTEVLKAYEWLKDYLEESSKYNYSSYIKAQDILKMLNEFREKALDEGYESGKESRGDEFYDEAFSDGYEEGKHEVCEALADILRKFD